MPKHNVATSQTTECSPGFIRERYNAVVKRLCARHHRHYKGGYFHLWADLLLAGIIVGAFVSLVWLLVWQPKPAFILDAEISNSKVVSGQTNDFVIKYSNEEDRMINGATLKLELPKGFVLESTAPAELFDVNSATFKLGDLEADASGELTVRGQVRGAHTERQTLGLIMNYRQDNVLKQLLDSVVYHIDGSVIELGLEVPEKTYTNIDFNGTVSVKNTGTTKLDKVELIFPDADIEVSGYEMANNRTIISLEGGEQKLIEFMVRERETGEKAMNVEAALEIDQKYVKQTEVRREFTVVGPGLSVAASIRENGLAARNTVATLDLEAKNMTTEPISEISFTINGRQNANIKNLAIEGDATIRGTTVFLAQPLAPAAKTRLAVRTEIEREEVSFNTSLSLRVNVSYLAETQKVEYSLSTESARVSSNLSLQSGGYYYGPQGDQLGVGPIPPRVDIPTTYWIIWQVNNIGNDINNLEVSADLPASVVWTDQQSVTAGEITYSPMTKRVLWKPGTVTKNGGNYRASFAVTIVPSAADLGKTPLLARNILYKGTDAYTGQILSRTAADISTAIPTDSRSSGKGIVEPTE